MSKMAVTGQEKICIIFSFRQRYFLLTIIAPVGYWIIHTKESGRFLTRIIR